MIDYRAGHIFEGPEGQAYKLTREIRVGDFLLADDFIALNGAPKPEAGQLMPKWLAKWFTPPSEVGSA